MLKRPFLLLFVLLIVSIFFINQAYAGRRGVRVDLGAWNPAISIVPYQGIVTDECPGAGVTAELLVEPLYQQGYVMRNSIMFQAAPSVGLVLSQFYCQHSRPYEPLADPAEYLNASIFPADEQGLASLVGDNTDNSVSAIRYSFLQSDPNGEFGRQWAFYFFPDGLTVVALYGVPEGEAVYPYEMIFDLFEPPYPTLWSSEQDGFTGQYFCFQGREYVGDCVPPPPPPPEIIYMSGFESD